MLSHARFAWAVVGALLVLGACSSSSSGSGDTPADAGRDAGGITFPTDAAGARDVATTHAGDAGHDATTGNLDATSPDASTGGDDAANDAGFDGSFGDVITIGPPPFDSSIPDSASDAPVLDACGICDRLWSCNGFTDHWVSEGADACADIRTIGGSAVTVATLYCENGDTINYPDATNNDGTWATTSTGLALYYDDFGNTMEIDCVPGS